MLVSVSDAGSGPAIGNLSPTLRGWKQIIEPVSPFLDQVALSLNAQVEAFEPEIASYARYALTNQGKQLRPVLVGLSGAAFSKPSESLVKVAVIIEMVHLATLVHDDIMDEAEVRRSRPTLARNWGNEISVLLGDCLFAHAVALAASFPTPEICRAVAIATNRVCTGEILQTNQRRRFDLSFPDYFKAVEMKTGELFALACDLGALLGGANPVQRQTLREFGLLLGTAYQVYDDCLDVFGSEALVGKSLGTDLASGKLTLPLLFVLESASAAERTLITELLQDWDSNYFPQIFELLERYEALNRSRIVIFKTIHQAQELLGQLPQNSGVAPLNALGGFLLQQTEALGVS
ncbi:MAG: polyprenyl synthetase family protein [Verrucomicrobiota bacterium]|nr:polyprenyl synthetase family protein [Verrucomicrobiota bacterium]